MHIQDMTCHWYLQIVADFSNGCLGPEHAGDDAWSSLSSTLLHILSIISSNDILASLGMIHHRVVMWKEAVEAPVEHTSSDERVDVANGEELLPTLGHTGLTTTCNDNIVDEAWEWRNATNEESCHRTPIAAELLVVSVNAVEVVHVWHGDIALADDEVAGSY